MQVIYQAAAGRGKQGGIDQGKVAGKCLSSCLKADCLSSTTQHYDLSFPDATQT
jgi:hypothetical protein